MRAGVHVRVHPQRDPRGAPERRGERGEHVELLGAFDIDLRDVLGEREAQFALRLADAGEHDAVRRNAGGAGAAEFALADHVGAKAFAAEQVQHRQPVVRLHRVMHMRVQRGVVQRGPQCLRAAAHGGGGIHPARRADGFGDAAQGDAVQAQPVHRMHRELRARGDQFVGRGFCGIGGEDSGHEAHSSGVPHGQECRSGAIGLWSRTSSGRLSAPTRRASVSIGIKRSGLIHPDVCGPRSPSIQT